MTRWLWNNIYKLYIFNRTQLGWYHSREIHFKPYKSDILILKFRLLYNFNFELLEDNIVRFKWATINFHREYLPSIPFNVSIAYFNREQKMLKAGTECQYLSLKHICILFLMEQCTVFNTFINFKRNYKSLQSKNNFDWKIRVGIIFKKYFYGYWNNFPIFLNIVQ